MKKKKHKAAHKTISSCNSHKISHGITKQNDPQSENKSQITYTEDMLLRFQSISKHQYDFIKLVVFAHNSEKNIISAK